jgi:hypothetical protein
MLDRVAVRYRTKPSLILRDEVWALDFDWAIAQIGGWAQARLEETEFVGKGENRKQKPKHTAGEVFRKLNRAAVETFEGKAPRNSAPPKSQHASFDDLAALAKLQG